MNTMLIGTQEQFKMRVPQIEEVDALCEVVEKYNRLTQNIGVNADWIRSEWSLPDVDVDNDWRVVTTQDGQFVAFTQLWNNRPPYVRAFLWVAIDPAYWGQGIEEAIYAWAEARMQEKVTLAPEDAQVAMQVDIFPTTQLHLQDILEQAGYSQTRLFWMMRIDLDQDIPEAQFPEGITIKSHADVNDLHGVMMAVDDAFTDHWGHVPMVDPEKALKHWEHRANKDNDPVYDPTLWFLAMDGDEIAAMSLCLSEMDGNPHHAYVDTLGVRRNWRRKGLGLAMLHHTFRVMKERGKEAVLLDVDATSLTGADKLYKKAGMYVALEGIVYEKIIRAGKDYTTQTLED